MRSSDLALCQRCGLCCDGSLFGNVKVSEEDRARLGEASVRRLNVVDSGAFPQPCNALGQSGCSVYAERPRPCRDFVCRLLERVERGETNEDAALGTVAEMKVVIAGLRAALRVPPEDALARAVAAQSKDLHADGRTLILLAGYERLKAKHFEGAG